MLISIPVDVKYKNELHKAHTQFNIDAVDFEKFQKLGAWVYKSEEKIAKTKKN